MEKRHFRRVFHFQLITFIVNVNLCFLLSTKARVLFKFRFTTHLARRYNPTHRKTHKYKLASVPVTLKKGGNRRIERRPISRRDVFYRFAIQTITYS